MEKTRTLEEWMALLERLYELCGWFVVGVLLSVLTLITLRLIFDHKYRTYCEKKLNQTVESLKHKVML